MKKRLPIFCITLLMTVNINAQIQKVTLPELKKIGVAKYMGVLVAELSCFPSSKDTSYSLLFNNEKYKAIVDLVRIDFDNSPGILDSLYNILNAGFDLDKGKQSNFTLGKDFISITTEKSMGIKFIQIMALDKKAYFHLRKKQLNELFNRTE